MSEQVAATTATTYDEIKHLTEVPLSKRTKIESFRGNKILPRRYHHTEKTAAKAKQLFSEMRKQIENPEVITLAGEEFYVPFRPSGPYCGAIMALYILGANQYHELCIVKNQMKDWMSKVDIDEFGQSSWQRFEGKLPREGAVNAKDVTGRIHDNMRVFQRLGGHNPCGNKLAEIHCCVDIKRDKDGKWYYSLNTHFDKTKMKPVLSTKEFTHARAEQNSSTIKAKRFKKMLEKRNFKLIEEMRHQKGTAPSLVEVEA